MDLLPNVEVVEPAPEPKEEIEPDIDAIGDEMWLRKKEQEEQEEKDD